MFGPRSHTVAPRDGNKAPAVARQQLHPPGARLLAAKVHLASRHTAAIIIPVSLTRYAEGGTESGFHSMDMFYGGKTLTGDISSPAADAIPISVPTNYCGLVQETHLAGVTDLPRTMDIPQRVYARRSARLPAGKTTRHNST